MKTIKVIISVILLFVFLQGAHAQQSVPVDSNCKIKGVLVDADDQVPVEFANVVLYALNKTVVVTWSISGDKGAFELSKIPQGEYDLAITFVGYEDKKMQRVVFNKPGFTLDLGIINFNKVATAIGEVSVVGVQKTYQSKIDKKVINVSKDINSTGGDCH
ncbi:MAG: carboxypeptidase-like regulatory domain-containing protein [Mariniphaga sp.]|nr:carboxypeptidase-like regulatory domain-containing protein [Mariniphaga sp.]